MVGSTLTAIFAIVTLLGGDLRGISLCIISVAALLVVYIAILPRTSPDSYDRPFSHLDVDYASLSLRVVILLVVALGLQAAIFSAPKGKVIPVFLLGLSKSLAWYYTIQAVCESV